MEFKSTQYMGVFIFGWHTLTDAFQFIRIRSCLCIFLLCKKKKSWENMFFASILDENVCELFKGKPKHPKLNKKWMCMNWMMLLCGALKI